MYLSNYNYDIFHRAVGFEYPKLPKSACIIDLTQYPNSCISVITFMMPFIVLLRSPANSFSILDADLREKSFILTLPSEFR